MSITKAACAVGLIMCASSAMAEKPGDMPNPYYDAVAAKLMASGYRDIRMVDLGENTLLAYDRDGSEVRLLIHATDRRVLRVEPVHPGDQ